MRRAEVGFAVAVVALGLALWWAAGQGVGWPGWPGWPPQGLGWLLLPLFLLAGLAAGAVMLVVGLALGLIGVIMGMVMAVAGGLLGLVMVFAMFAGPLGLVVLVVYLLVRGRRPAARAPSN